jgi:hypothetical protein
MWSLETTVVQRGKKKRTWSHVFCALASSTSENVPSRSAMLELTKCGLGLKEVTFIYDASSEDALETLLWYLYTAYLMHFFLNSQQTAVALLAGCGVVFYK